MMGFILLVLVAVGIAWATKRMSDREENTYAVQPRFSSDRDLQLSLPERVQRRPGEPLIHKTALYSLLPYGGLMVLFLGLTIAFSRSALPVLLLAGGFFLVLAAVGVKFNQTARREWQLENDRDAEVKESMESLEEFTIPEEWSRYL